MQADVHAGLLAAAVLAVDVAVDPGEQQVQAGSHGPGGAERGRGVAAQCVRPAGSVQNSDRRSVRTNCGPASPRHSSPRYGCVHTGSVTIRQWAESTH